MDRPEDSAQDKFYQKAVQYWSDIPATVDGMLGGFGHISQVDIRSSKQFLKLLFQSKKPPGKEKAIDCGAGIGRISKHLLVNIFETVDLVEQNPGFLEQAKTYLGPRDIKRIGHFYPIGLQSFEPDGNSYDVIWCQWVLGHLTDEHLLDFLRSCIIGLKENGVIIIKENVTSSGKIETDEGDSSNTRPFSHFMKLFQDSGLHCYKKAKQMNFPKGLYTVYMFALRPQTETLATLNIVNTECIMPLLDTE